MAGNVLRSANMCTTVFPTDTDKSGAMLMGVAVVLWRIIAIDACDVMLRCETQLPNGVEIFV